jgi:hypothetical protein
MLLLYTKSEVIQRVLIVQTYGRKKPCKEFSGKFLDWFSLVSVRSKLTFHLPVKEFRILFLGEK